LDLVAASLRFQTPYALYVSAVAFFTVFFARIVHDHDQIREEHAKRDRYVDSTSPSQRFSYFPLCINITITTSSNPGVPPSNAPLAPVASAVVVNMLI
jgi:hypothetical protein